MSSRTVEKERRHQVRRRQEQERAAQEKRARRRAILGPLAVGLVAVAAITIAALRSGGDDPAGAPVSDVAASAPFGQHYDGLVQRREAAQVPTMMETMNSRVHVHPVLELFVNGKPVTVPANIGIDPRVDGMQMAGLHTHDASGTIHVEGVAGARLGQFFAIWGVPFSARQLGPYRAGAGKSVRMWVEGKRSNAFGELKLADGQRIVVSFGPAGAPAPGA
jgi:hypothetical protein